MKSLYDYNENRETMTEFSVQNRGGYHVSSAYDTLYTWNAVTMNERC